MDRLDLQQGFADYNLSAGSGQLVLRAGRQEMSYDEGAIIGLRDGPNVRLSFDGVRGSYVDPTYALDAFAVRPVNVSPGALDDGDLVGQAIYGVHATVTPHVRPGARRIDTFVFGNTMPAVSLYPTPEPEQTATASAHAGGCLAAVSTELWARSARPATTAHATSSPTPPM